MYSATTVRRHLIQSDLQPIERNEETECLFDWTLSPEAQADIKEIERNIRNAPRNCRHIRLD